MFSIEVATTYDEILGGSDKNAIDKHYAQIHPEIKYVMQMVKIDFFKFLFPIRSFSYVDIKHYFSAWLSEGDREARLLEMVALKQAKYYEIAENNLKTFKGTDLLHIARISPNRSSRANPTS